MLVTANYWSGYGAGPVRLWLRLFDSSGAVLAQWEEPVPPRPRRHRDRQPRGPRSLRPAGVRGPAVHPRDRSRRAFPEALQDQAGPRGYVIIRDATCRLFGYNGLMDDHGAFSLDHMFGF